MNKKYLITFGLLGLIGLGTLAAGIVGLSTGAAFALPTLITAGAILGAMILGAFIMLITGLIKQNTQFILQGMTSLLVLLGLSALVVAGLSEVLSIPASTTSLLASSSTTLALPPSTIFMIAGGIALFLAITMVVVNKIRASEKVDTNNFDPTSTDVEGVSAEKLGKKPSLSRSAHNEHRKWNARNKVTDKKVRATRVLSFLETRLLNPSDKGVTASANDDGHFCLQLSQEAIASAIDVYNGDYDIMEQKGQKETQGQVNQIKPKSSKKPVAVDSNFTALYRYPKDEIVLKSQKPENCPKTSDFEDKTQDEINAIHNGLNLLDVRDACLDFDAQKGKNTLRVEKTKKALPQGVNRGDQLSYQTLTTEGPRAWNNNKNQILENEAKIATTMGEGNQGGSNDEGSESFESMAKKWGLHKLFTHWSDRGKNSVELLAGMRNKLQDSSNSQDKSKSNSVENHLKLTIVGRTNTVDQILEENQQNTDTNQNERAKVARIQ